MIGEPELGADGKGPQEGEGKPTGGHWNSFLGAVT